MLRQRQALGGGGESALVELAIPSASSQQACDGAEYWLVRGSTARLLAQDCDAQREADGRAHAQLRLESNEVRVDYEAALSSDNCAGSAVRVRQSDWQISSEARWVGTRRHGRCVRDEEFSVDWQTADHLAHWTTRLCAEKPAAGASVGMAIPAFELPGAPADLALGSCAARLDGAAAGRWQRTGASPGSELRAAVVNGALLIEVQGAVRGTLSLLVASSGPGDGALGADQRCGSAADYGLSTTTINLESGRVSASGPQAVALQLRGRDPNGIRLSSPGIGELSHFALSYVGPDGLRLDSARLSTRALASELPPLSKWFESAAPCQVQSGLLERLSVTEGRTPLLRLADP